MKHNPKRSTSTSAERERENESTFEPSRLMMARHRRGLTLTALSELSGVSTRMLSRYENRKTEPTTETVADLAQALGFPRGYLYRPEIQEVPAEGVSFRSLARTPAKQRDAVRRTAEAAWELDTWLDERFERPEPDLPDLSDLRDDPAAAAAALRAEWGLGVQPIKNLTRLLEAKGVRVYALDNRDDRLDPRNVDGLSMWWTGVPFVFVSPDGTAERMRMNLAHEVGHLLLHRHGAVIGQEAESQATSFAGHFLVPGRDLLAQGVRAELGSIVHQKARWGVAAIALVYRMKEEGLMPQWRYQDLCIRLRSRYGRGEPNEGAREMSTALPRMLAQLSREGIDRRRIANDLDVHVSDLDALLNGLVLLPVEPEVDPTETRRLRLEK